MANIFSFFRFGNRANRINNDVLTPEEKKVLYKARNTISNTLDTESPKNPTEEKTSQSVFDAVVSDSNTLQSSLGADFQQTVNIYSKYIYSLERDKRTRIALYREMAKYPEIAFAVDEYVDEAINENEKGEYIELHITNKLFRENDNQRKTILYEFDYLMNEVIKIDKFIYQWFREYMIDGEIFFEKVFDINQENKGIIKIERLPTEKIYPIWKNPESDEILFFAYQGDGTNAINVNKNLVAYANSGKYDWSRDNDMKVVLSFLEESKVTYKRLKLLEDALVIYRIVRAPERRVFKIDVGSLPKGRAEQFMQEMIRKYRQRKFFDPVTGDIAEGLDSMAMTEDFWFPVFQGGRGSDVTTLQGGQGLGEVADVEYFLNKLYRGLKIPKSRFGEDNKFSIGDTSDITREEVKFMKEVKRYSDRFSYLFKDIFLTHLKLRGIAEEYGISEQDFKIKLCANNLFEKFLAAKIYELRFGNFEKFKDLINTEKPIFSRKWVVQKLLEITDEEWNLNQELLAQENYVSGYGY
ncbi:MAG: portal protein [Candidatus Dojkabacteria bacterium]|nr:portal protein [Candidatus Dojkabacteria bacterium]